MGETKEYKWKKLVFVVVILLILVVLYEFSGHREVTVNTICKANLAKILDTSQLSTIEYTYNAVVAIDKQYFDSNKYYVLYEGTVQAGIDFSKISINIDENHKIITILIPDVTIQSTNPRAETLEFLFTDNEYNTENVFAEAYNACVSDLKLRAENETALFDMARENAKSAVMALISPWVMSIDSSYTVVIE